MPAQTKHTAIAQRSRVNLKRRKNKKGIGRTSLHGPKNEAPASKIVADSLFALNIKPKRWSDLQPTKDSDKEMQALYEIYSDLVKCYNHGADLVKCKRIVYKRSDTSRSAVSELLESFKKNICPAGFSVNIDSHQNKKSKRLGHHFTVYKECKFPTNYWHFFDIKNLVEDLQKRNRKLHDFFVIFLKSFIERCKIPTWWDYQMEGSQYELSSYLDELKGVMKQNIPQEQFEKLGYTRADMEKRIADISTTMKEYATGAASKFMVKIKQAPVRTAASLLKSLKLFPYQNPLVQFMKNACGLMKRPCNIGDFCYTIADGHDEGEMGFDQQLTICWDWSDHYSATHGNHLIDLARQIGVTPPTLAGLFLPSGVHGLKMENLTDNLDFPKELSLLQAQFQKITEKYTDYNKRDLL